MIHHITDYGWLSVLPPLLAIVAAIASRQVFISLFLGIWLGKTIIAGWSPINGLTSAVGSVVGIFQSPDNTRVILFCILVGAMITLTQRSGGMEGFLSTMASRNLVTKRVHAELLAFFVGILVFIESSITSLMVGSLSRPLFDHFKIPREKLAYICNSTAAPICILIPLNAWGAYIINLLEREKSSYPIVSYSTKIFIYSIFYNFYAWLALLMVLLIILTGKNYGPMKTAEERARQTGKVLRDGAEPLISAEVTSLSTKEGVKPRALNMFLPVVSMVITMPVALFITGGGHIGNLFTSGYLFEVFSKASGSASVLWAVITGIIVAASLYLYQRILNLHEIMDLIFRGVGGLIPLAALMMLAFALGDLSREMGTGPFVALIAKENIPKALLPMVAFTVSAIIGFATGTSWGTFAIMTPIGVALASGVGVSLPLIIGAILGGGVFGDQSSPVSDTAIVASMASASDHMDHINTQLPYTLTAATATAIIYLVIGCMYI